MKFRTAGTDWSHIPLPLFEGEGVEGAAGDPAAAAAAAKPAEGSVEFDAGKAYADLDADTRTWLQKVGVDKDPKALATKAYNQEKLLGSAIQVPGKDATQEERDAFLNRLGRPESADKYELKVPEKMPEGLPYDGEFAKRAAATAHKLGLTQEQFAGLHDLFVAEQVEGYTKLQGEGAAQVEAKAIKAGEELTKLWGPLDGATAKANFEIADKVFKMLPGGQELLQSLKEKGYVGPNKEILDVPLAKAFAAIGAALYTEDGHLRGQADIVGNVFDSTSPEFNVTAQMDLARKDPGKAASLIAAAGKKPTDFGLPANFGA